MTNSSYLGLWKGTGSRQWFLCPKGDCGIEEKGSIHGVIDKKGGIGQSILMVKQSSNTFRTKKLEQQTLYLECWMMYLLRYTA